jgi:DNA invertase Pin-like site-specific DNA recombinase
MEKRAAIYLRVSTEQQTVENQRPDLQRAAKVRRLATSATYAESASTRVVS